MKIKAAILLLLLGCSKLGMAQRLESFLSTQSTQSYFHVGYVIHELKNENTLRNFESDWGLSLSVGKTYFLERRPIADLLKVGIDWSFADLNYSHFNLPWETREWIINKFEVGMQVGPAIIFYPSSRIRVHTYFRYAPSFSGMYDNQWEAFGSGFGSYFAAGAKIHFFGKLGAGIEQRWGSSNTTFSGGKVDGAKHKIELKGPRIFLSFGY